MLQTISLRLREIPILEDNPLGCFPEKYFPGVLRSLSLMWRYTAAFQHAYTHMLLTCNHGDVNGPEGQLPWGQKYD